MKGFCLSCKEKDTELRFGSEKNKRGVCTPCWMRILSESEKLEIKELKPIVKVCETTTSCGLGGCPVCEDCKEKREKTQNTQMECPFAMFYTNNPQDYYLTMETTCKEGDVLIEMEQIDLARFKNFKLPLIFTLKFKKKDFEKEKLPLDVPKCKLGYSENELLDFARNATKEKETQQWT